MLEQEGEDGLGTVNQKYEAISLKPKTELLCDPETPTGIYSEKMKNYNSERYMGYICMKVKSCSVVSNSL